jgi:hypothetical protein
VIRDIIIANDKAKPNLFLKLKNQGIPVSDQGAGSEGNNIY